MKELSVVIVTYNSEPDIYGCLDALFAHNDLDDALEVIVVDNNSRDFTHMQDEIARLYGGKVIVLSNSQNGGYGQGNNIGIRHASSPVIMIMNPDVQLDTKSLTEIVRAFKEDKRIAMYGMKQLSMNGKHVPSFFFINTSNALERSIGTFLANKLDIYLSKKMCFSGACFCVRTSMMRTIKGFDEHIFMYGEEHDLHYRLRKAFPASFHVYNPHICYKHKMDKRDFSEKAYRQRIESNMYIFQKQHLAPKRFIQTEDQCNRIVRFLKRIMGNQDSYHILTLQHNILLTYA